MNIRRNDIVFVKGTTEINGSVQSYDRPAVVIQNNIGNEHSSTLIVAYVTGQIKKLGMPTHVVLAGYEGLRKTSMFMAEQIATISKDNVEDVMDHLRSEDIVKVNSAISSSFDLREVA